MTDKILSSGNRAVIVSGMDRQYTAVSYVNARYGIAHASPLRSRTFKTVSGAERWANRQLTA